MAKIIMKDIADNLGLSINAVSLALNDKKGVSEETRLRVLEAAQAQGYLDTKHNYSRIFGQYHICVLIRDEYSRDAEFYGEILHSIIKEARKSGYDTLVQYFDDENLAIPDYIAARRVSGIIILGKISTPNVDALRAFNLHVVVIDHSPRSCKMNCILTDNISGGFMAANYLIHSGCTEIGFVGDLSYALSVKERYYGFLEALTQGNIITSEQPDTYVQKYSLMNSVESYSEKLTDVLNQMLSRMKDLPQAYFCYNDQTAFALMHVLQEKGIRVPGEISIIGFDNTSWAERVSPQLTTMSVNRELMGQKAVRRIIRLIKEEDQEIEHTVLGVELVVRNSVASC
ncbi:LacI family transcriptional regulator [Spirochaetia bacterium]|nr:LacI family transcriptional regulator [Spirochaetia bacterium]